MSWLLLHGCVQAGGGGGGSKRQQGENERRELLLITNSLCGCYSVTFCYSFHGDSYHGDGASSLFQTCGLFCMQA